MVIDCEENDDGIKNSEIHSSLKKNIKNLFQKKLGIDDQPKADVPSILNSP